MLIKDCKRLFKNKTAHETIPAFTDDPIGRMISSLSSRKDDAERVRLLTNFELPILHFLIMLQVSLMYSIWCWRE